MQEYESFNSWRDGLEWDCSIIDLVEKGKRIKKDSKKKIEEEQLDFFVDQRISVESK